LRLQRDHILYKLPLWSGFNTSHLKKILKILFKFQNDPVIRFNDKILDPNEHPIINYERAQLFLDDEEDKE
jgi:hypothetical protein